MSITIEKAIRKGAPQTTRSGYDSRLRTSIMVRCAGKWRRLCAVCHGNAPSVYVIIKGERVFIHDCDIPEISEN